MRIELPGFSVPDRPGVLLPWPLGVTAQLPRRSALCNLGTGRTHPVPRACSFRLPQVHPRCVAPGGNSASGTRANPARPIREYALALGFACPARTNRSPDRATSKQSNKTIAIDRSLTSLCTRVGSVARVKAARASPPLAKPTSRQPCLDLLPCCSSACSWPRDLSPRLIRSHSNRHHRSCRARPQLPVDITTA